MKILFYINTLEHGGAERVMANLANELNKRKYEVVFITSYPTKSEYPINLEIKRLYLDQNVKSSGFIKRNLSRIKSLREICKNENADVIISFMAEPNFRTIIATRFLSIKSIISVRNDPYKEYRNIFTRLMAKILYSFSTGCVFQTKDAMSFFPKSVQKKSQIILNPVNKKFYNAYVELERKNIVTVGRLESQKNHELLIKSFSKVCNNIPNDNLLIYGKGSKEKELQNLIRDLDMENRIFLMGEHEKIDEKIRNAKLFVLSSDYEGMPNVLMEAMALGIPVISTDCPCGGPRALINNENCGVLTEVNDELGLQEAMKNLINDPKRLKELSNNAKIRAAEFAPEKIFDQWESFIIDI